MNVKLGLIAIAAVQSMNGANASKCVVQQALGTCLPYYTVLY